MTSPTLMLASAITSKNNITYRVNVDLDAWVVRRVCTREGNEGPGSSAATTSNAELSASDIKLSSTSVARLVQGNMLDPQEVITF
jgi:hypothetical protein